MTGITMIGLHFLGEKAAHCHWWKSFWAQCLLTLRQSFLVKLCVTAAFPVDKLASREESWKWWVVHWRDELHVLNWKEHAVVLPQMKVALSLNEAFESSMGL